MQYSACPITLEVLEHILFEKKKLEHILNDQMSKLNHITSSLSPLFYANCGRIISLFFENIIISLFDGLYTNDSVSCYSDAGSWQMSAS